MTRSMIVNLFYGSLIALAGGVVLGVVAVILGLSTRGLMMRGPDIVGMHSNGSGVAIVVFAILSGLLLLLAAVGQVIAWIGGVINTAGLPDKTWFVVLLVVGLLGFVLIANILYLVSRADLGSGSLSRQGSAPSASVASTSGHGTTRGPAAAR